MSLRDAGAVYKYDLSLPPDDMYKLVEETRERMKQLPVTVVGYGHMGDSNLHLNISAGEAWPQAASGCQLSSCLPLHELTQVLSGAFSHMPPCTHATYDALDAAPDMSSEIVKPHPP